MLSANKQVKNMNYSAYYSVDVINGKGTRCTLFVSGCTHMCKGCYNKSTWSFEHGFLFDRSMEDKIIEDLNDKRIIRNGLSITGGDPLHPKNIDSVLSLVNRVKSECSADKNIWCWTGYKLDELIGFGDKYIDILSKIDILVDGKFILSKKDPSLPWRGSSNQNIIKLSTIDF